MNYNTNQCSEYAVKDTEGRNIADTLTELENKPSGVTLYKHTISTNTERVNLVVISYSDTPFNCVAIPVGPWRESMLNKALSMCVITYEGIYGFSVNKVIEVGGASTVYNFYYRDEDTYVTLDSANFTDTVTPL